MVIDGAVEVQKPIGLTFEYLADYRNRTQFIRFISGVRLETEQESGVGTRYTEIATVLGQDLETTYEVIEFEAPNRVLVQAVNAPFPIESTVELQDLETSTQIQITLAFELKGIFRIGRPLIRNFIQAELNKILRQIQIEVEKL